MHKDKACYEEDIKTKGGKLHEQDCTKDPTSGEETCEANAEFDQGTADGCEYSQDDWAETDPNGLWQKDGQYYYERGFGLMGLKGHAEYTEFSKAVFGDEKVLTENPNLIFTYDEHFPILALAVHIWRYMGMYHSALPSSHDVVTGFWQPTEAHTALNLKSGDFCTLVSVVAAQVVLRESADKGKTWPTDDMLKPSDVEMVADGSLGKAAFAMATIFNLKPPGPAEYDWECSETGAWPEPDREANPYVDLYLDTVPVLDADDVPTGATVVAPVPYHTSYTLLVEGDPKRAGMDHARPTETITARRAANSYSGAYCIPWDNEDGNNPQPWDAYAVGDATGEKNACAFMDYMIDDNGTPAP